MPCWITLARTPQVLGFAVVFAFLVVLASAPQRADAGLLQSFTWDGPGDFDGNGLIEFESGMGSTPDDLVSFSVSGSFQGTSFDFGLDDVDTASWQLNPNDWSFEQFFLTINPDPPSLIDIFFLSGAQLSMGCVVDNSMMCSANGNADFSASTPVSYTSIPEPSSALIFLTGLAALSLFGWGARRRRAVRAA